MKSLVIGGRSESLREQLNLQPLKSNKQTYFSLKAGRYKRALVFSLTTMWIGPERHLETGAYLD